MMVLDGGAGGGRPELPASALDVNDGKTENKISVLEVVRTSSEAVKVSKNI